MTRPIRWMALLALLLLPLLSHATDVQATLDRSQVQLGETVTLNLHTDDGSSFGMPDLSSISGDFAVLSQSSGQTMSIINGQRKVEFNLGIALRPLREGDLQIPALDIAGARTKPLTVHVVAPDPSAAANANKPVFLEASVTPSTVYVGQQLALSVKLYFLANLANATLEDPRIDGVDVSRIGGDMNYQAERNGRSYNVIERRYVLVPQKPGELDIPPVRFQGDLLDPNDPDSFLGMGAPVSAVSAPLQVQVKAAPASWGSSDWLPARKLSLTMDGQPDANTPLRVGQPFNLTMLLEATGIPYEALPSLSLPAMDGATTYPDKPVTGNRSDSPWVVGRREQQFAVVPEKAGKLTIPAISLKWWNVLTDQAETATIPAHTYTVLTATGAAAPAAPAVPAAAASTAAVGTGDAGAPPPPTPTTALADVLKGSSPWRLVALASLGLWLLSVLSWLLWRALHRRAPRAARLRKTPAPHSSKQLHKAFLQAADAGDSQAQARSLLAWARSERPAVTQLEALSDALASPEQRGAVATLQRQRYAAAGAASAGPALKGAFASGFEWRRADIDQNDDDPLPPLYPFKLH